MTGAWDKAGESLLQRTAPPRLQAAYDRTPAGRPPGAPAVLDLGRLVLVRVAGDGGDAGDAATDCTLTYAATDLAGTALTHADGTAATGLTPAVPRYPLTTYLPAGAGGRSDLALAAWIDGVLTLLHCFGEIADSGACP